MESTTLPPSTMLKIYDQSVCENQYIDIDVPLDQFGKFANFFIPNLKSLIQIYNKEKNNFPQAVENCKSMMLHLKSFLHDQTFDKLIDKTTELLERINTDQEKKMEEIREITYKIFNLYDMRIRRAQIQLTLITNRQNKTREVIQAQEAINKHVSGYLQTMSLSDENTHDPLLVTVNACKEFEKYLKVHNKLCSCAKEAVVYAVPCNCPCYCLQCWNNANKNENICPTCAKPITQFVELKQ